MARIDRRAFEMFAATGPLDQPDDQRAAIHRLRRLRDALTALECERLRVSQEPDHAGERPAEFARLCAVIRARLFGTVR